ncbi:homocysteine S-methyltransferase [Shimia isoporae]|uniref:Homocysteine S-methyltransferase n=1 Tax=Shimia isoporae TaxID=647720 RepID=A0A4R1N2M5_9RHOB|nr:homocysteine S-methyltransferase family protein [Shimia isoporae]TCL00641.1 homocysteine S-methyltransferase [Shimia isoporae]
MTSVILKDGGTGQELLARSSMPPHPLWSCKVMMEEPEIVRGVHADYIRSGARLLTLNTYTVTPERLEREGEPDMFVPLQRRAIELVDAAREEVGVEGVKVAGCLSPLHGSYRPDMAMSHNDLLPLYREIVEGQVEASDLILAETLSSIAEVTSAAQAAVETGLPTWVFLTLNDDESGTLRSGEPLSDAVAALDGSGVAGIGINCCKPEVVDANLAEVQRSGLPTGAYANGFTGIDALEIGGTVDGLKARKDLTPVAYAEFAMRWAQQGLGLIGGCCEVGPSHIAELSKQLIDAGYDVVGA